MIHAMRTSFQVAVDHLLELIGATFANASYQGKRRSAMSLEWNRDMVAKGGIGGRNGQGGRSGGRAGRGANRNGKSHNGVDITDLTQNFSNEEWRKLSPEIIQQIQDARAAGKAARGAPKRNVAAVIAKPVDEQQQGAVSNGTGFGSRAYSNKRRAVPRQRES
jgi:hypothetical protein